MRRRQASGNSSVAATGMAVAVSRFTAAGLGLFSVAVLGG
jgi:hypothetical protein